METITWNQVEYTMVYYENAITEGIMAQIEYKFVCSLYTRDEKTIVVKLNMN